MKNKTTQGSRELRLQVLGDKATELTKAYETMFGEAAAVCLEERGHSPGVKLKVDGFVDVNFLLDWNPSTNEMERTYQDEQKATEYGAVGIALVIIREIADLKAFEVSRKNNGFDYWMSKKEDVYPFKKAARLEITGIRQGTNSEKRSRLQKKIDRLRKYPDPIPAFIVVVEFGEPGSMVEQRL